MALATKCPHCNTTFRVASDQLKLRGGIVRCGACNELFDGNATLVDAPASEAALPGALGPPAVLPLRAPAAAPLEPANVAASAQPEALAPEETPAGIDAAVQAQDGGAAATGAIDSLDFDISYDPFHMLSTPPRTAPLAGLAPAADKQQPEHQSRQTAQDAVLPRPEALAEPEILSLPEQLEQPEQLDQPEHLDQPEQPEQLLLDGEQALPAPDDGAVLPFKRSRPDPDAVAAALASPAAPAAPAPVAEPDFITQGRRRQRSGKTVNVLLGAGSLLLLLAMLAQGLSMFRTQLAAQMPALKPTLVAMCARLGCRVELPAQIEYVGIDQGELQTLSKTTYSYATVMHNQSGAAQAWPALELILNDANDKPVLRRVFTAAEYLGAPMTPDQGLAAHSEHAVKLYFELAGVKASGYHIAVFYP